MESLWIHWSFFTKLLSPKNLSLVMNKRLNNYWMTFGKIHSGETSKYYGTIISGFCCIRRKGIATKQSLVKICVDFSTFSLYYSNL